MHANYSLEFQLNQYADEYLPHRISQLFELGKFIQQTANSSDLCLLLGDLNTCDNETGYKMLTTHASLLDAYLQRPEVSFYKVRILFSVSALNITKNEHILMLILIL